MQDNPSILAEALIPEAVQELFRQEHLLGGMRAFLPEELIAYLLKEKDQIRNVVDFQSRIILPILKLIEQASITKLTSSGLDHLDKNENTCLFPTTAISCSIRRISIRYCLGRVSPPVRLPLATT